MNDPAANLSGAAREIIALHEFFVAWFTGDCENSDACFEQNLVSHFDTDFTMIPPSGELLSGAALWAGLRGLYASNPDFRIQIRNIRERRLAESDVSIVTYEEWQRAALNSDPPNNARVSSGVLREDRHLPNGVRWLHVQETALPESYFAGDPFDF